MDGPDRPQLERVLPWTGRNLVRLAFYLAMASVVSSVLITFSSFGLPSGDEDFQRTAGEIVGVSLFLAFYGGMGCVPGLSVWLPIVARLPADWPERKRRVVAVATAPLVGAFWLVLFLVENALGFAFLFGLFWPLGAGLVVRLRQPNVELAAASD